MTRPALICALVLALALVATSASAQLTPDAGNDAGDAAAARARVTFEVLPKDVTDLEVTFDGRAVPIAHLARLYSIEPGRHEAKASARGGDGGYLVAREQIDAAPGSTTKVRLNLAQSEGTYLCGPDCEAPMRCLQTAKSEEDLQKCLCGPDRQRAGCQSCVVGGGGDSASWAGASVLVGIAALAFASRRRVLRLRRGS